MIDVPPAALPAPADAATTPGPPTPARETTPRTRTMIRYPWILASARPAARRRAGRSGEHGRLRPNDIDRRAA
jgi:hypothetical protein